MYLTLNKLSYLILVAIFSLFRALNSNVCFGRNPCQKNNIKLALFVKTSDSAIQQINYYCPEHKY